MPLPKHFVFEWPVDQGGYEVAHHEFSDPGPTATLLSHGRTVFVGDAALDHYRQERPGYYVIRGRGGPLRYYHPLEKEPGLWRRFSEKCTTIDALLEFVAEFGLLTDRTDLDGRALGDTTDDIFRIAEHIRNIAELLDGGERRAAGDLLVEYPPQVLELPRWNDLTARPEATLKPVNLLHALLHQAAESITNNYQWRSCSNEDCPEWFRVGTGAATSRREYCSNRCRVAAGRRRAVLLPPTRAAAGNQ